MALTIGRSSALSSVVVVDGASGEWTATITPTEAHHVRVAGAAASQCLSMSAGSTWERRTIENAGAYPVALCHEETGETAADRFACPGGVPYILRPGACVDVLYDVTSSRWRVIGVRAASDLWLPPAADFSALGYTLAAYFGCDDKSGALRDALGGGDLAAAGTPTYDARAAYHRGVGIVASGDAFSADILDPAAASQVGCGVFTVAAHAGADRALFGRYKGADSKGWYAHVGTDDTVKLYWEDGAGPPIETAAIGTLAFGVPMALFWQINRTLSSFSGLLANLNTLVASAVVSASIADEVDVTHTGPFRIAARSAVDDITGTGIIHHGLFAITAGVEAAAIAKLARRCFGAA